MSDEKKPGERIAKVMARSGVASRRDAERMIIEGRVAVNGKPVASPALDVTPADRVTLDGKPIDAPQPARLWLYYKPLGLVTSAKDEKGRQTVFDTMPEGMPRVMSVGRLDLNSEGLLLMTNDGALKRRMELPSTGWLRKYRVRVNGRPNEATFDPLRRGVTIDGEDFQPMEVSLDKQQGANAWLTVGLREGKNREVRRAMSEVGLIVNRLIRVSYGPFRLNTMKPGDVVEVKQRILRDQLGRNPADTVDEPATGKPVRRSRDGTRKDAGKDAGKPGPRSGASGPRRPRSGGETDAKPYGNRRSGDSDGDKRGGHGPDRAAKSRTTEDRAAGPRPDQKPRTPKAGNAAFGKAPDRVAAKPRSRQDGPGAENATGSARPRAKFAPKPASDTRSPANDRNRDRDSGGNNRGGGLGGGGKPKFSGKRNDAGGATGRPGGGPARPGVTRRDDSGKPAGRPGPSRHPKGKK